MKHILGLIVVLAAGYFIGVSTSGTQNNDGEHMAMEDVAGVVMHGSHDTIDLAVADAPSVDLTVHEDPKGGYNAQITFTKFRLAPENVSTENIPGEGHAHIYVDGVKINRVYGEWYHLGKIDDGAEVSVTLSTNDHREITVGGKLVGDMETVTATAIMEDDDHMHEDGEDDGYMHDGAVDMESES